jgi:hypothetical protein
MFEWGVGRATFPLTLGNSESWGGLVKQNQELVFQRLNKAEMKVFHFSKFQT